MNEHGSIFKHCFMALLAICSVGLNVGKAQPILEQYVAEGLSNNQGVRQEAFALQKNLLALEEAKRLFLPTVSLQANYFLAQGGRTVDFPVGDLLNPVYSTLNQLTQSNNFPQLENQSILLNPNNFYDAKLHTIQPILNAEIGINRNIKQGQVAVQETELGVFKRALVKDIKTAYFQYLKSLEATRIYASALSLVEEGLRINQSLVRNDKANRTAVVRSEGEVAKYQAQLEAAQKTSESAMAYFNFLLNRPLDAAITVDSSFAQLPPDLPLGTSIGGREELRQLALAAGINHELVELAKAQQRPKLNAFLDLGAQGFDFRVNGGSPYFFFGLAFDWNLFTAKRNDLKVQQAAVDNSILQARTSLVEHQLNLQLRTTLNDLLAAKSQHRSALAQELSAEKYYRDIVRLYKEGQAMNIELMDAQNQLVATRLQANISRFEVWIKLVAVENANASYPIQ